MLGSPYQGFEVAVHRGVSTFMFEAIALFMCIVFVFLMGDVSLTGALRFCVGEGGVHKCVALLCCVSCIH